MIDFENKKWKLYTTSVGGGIFSDSTDELILVEANITYDELKEIYSSLTSSSDATIKTDEVGNKYVKIKKYGSKIEQLIPLNMVTILQKK